MINTKKILAPFLALCMLFLAISPVSASEDANNGDTNPPVIEPYWWPGNPTPQPGSEAWLFQNPNYGTTSSALAKRCGKSALIDTMIPSVAETALAKWLLKAVFTVGSFGLAFTVNLSYNYGRCLYNNR